MFKASGITVAVFDLITEVAVVVPDFTDRDGINAIPIKNIIITVTVQVSTFNTFCPVVLGFPKSILKYPTIFPMPLLILASRSSRLW
jgi:hypothetical protein